LAKMAVDRLRDRRAVVKSGLRKAMRTLDS
jgi:hypothetical protein